MNGDRTAGEQLLLEVLPRVRNVIRVLVGRDRDVDDIAQIVMVNVIGSMAGYRGDAPLAAWVDRITARTTLAHVKKRRAKEHVETDFEEERSNALGPDERSAQPSETSVDVLKMLQYLDVLPEAQRQAVVLHYALGYTVPEAAEQQGVSGETFRSRLRLGLGRLRSWCGEAPARATVFAPESGGTARLPNRVTSPSISDGEQP